MTELVLCGALGSKEAYKIALAIAKSNPRYITAQILNEFARDIGLKVRRRR